MIVLDELLVLSGRRFVAVVLLRPSAAALGVNLGNFRVPSSVIPPTDFAAYRDALAVLAARGSPFVVVDEPTQIVRSSSGDTVAIRLVEVALN